MDLRGVALNSVGWTWRDEPFLFVTCGFTSREGKSRPFTDGLDVGERVGDPESCRESSEESDRAETAGASVRQFWSVPDADCEDRARGRPRTKPHLCEAK